MYLSDLPLFKARIFYKARLRDHDYVIFREEYIEEVSKLLEELHSITAISRRNDDWGKMVNGERYVINKSLLDFYTQYSMDCLSETRLSQDKQAELLLETLRSDYLINGNDTPRIDERILGSYKANPHLAQNSRKSTIHRLQLNSTLKLLARNEYISITSYSFDVDATPQTLAQEDEELLLVAADTTAQLDYVPAAFSRYVIELLPKFHMKSGAEMNVWRAIYFDTKKGLFQFGGETKKYPLKLGSRAYKVLRYFAENTSNLSVSSLFEGISDSTLIRDLVREVRFKLLLNKNQLISKAGNLILSGIKIHSRRL